jgi:ABC-2 type transport system permease protein
VRRPSAAGVHGGGALDWYSWDGTLAVVATFGLISTAAAMLIGALVRNESQSTAIGLALGLSLAALGGCMVPLDVFPEGLRTAAHLTPHAWANDAFDTLHEGGGLAGIGREVVVLATYGAGMLVVGAAALSRTITR